ncbi:MAG: hypothetical protein E7607_05630 [Ruminococcaceae bacterium]|nr:hypothetical protein [Oscillospiraceae bacterium]
MKKQGNKLFKKQAKRSQGASVRLRTVCAILGALAVLFSFVGCTSYATSEEMSVLKNDNEAYAKKVEQLKGVIGDAEKEIDALKENNTASQNEINTLKGNNTAAQNEISSLKATNEAMRQELESLKSDKETAMQEIEKLKEKFDQLENLPDLDDPTQKIKIYIDQGHNPTSYHNAGATGNGLYEQNLTFIIGKLLAQLLNEDGRFEVCLSRPTSNTVLGTDGDSSLDARVQGAKDFGADYFISLHTNAYESETANGIEVYVAEENSVSYEFGSKLLEGMIASTGLYNRGMKLGPKLRVLKDATMPAALLEMGFITNVQDSTMLSHQPYWFADGIYNGILSYFDLDPVQ